MFPKFSFVIQTSIGIKYDFMSASAQHTNAVLIFPCFTFTRQYNTFSKHFESVNNKLIVYYFLRIMLHYTLEDLSPHSFFSGLKHLQIIDLCGCVQITDRTLHDIKGFPLCIFSFRLYAIFTFFYF